MIPQILDGKLLAKQTEHSLSQRTAQLIMQNPGRIQFWLQYWLAMIHLAQHM